MIGRFAIPAYALLVAGLAAVNLRLAVAPPSSAPIAPQARSAAMAQAGGPADGTVQMRSFDIADAEARPLFDETRRPFVAQPEAPAAQPAEPAPLEPPPVEAAAPAQQPEFILLGIEKTPDAARVLLATAAGGAAAWHREGDIVDGWSVSRIDAGRIELSAGGRVMPIALHPPLPARAGKP